ncbi:MAG: hypothetical protein H0T73_17525 [Ardenticatenales bacterium]|nr:hypothetical protein [Ardenticatenales bacterium]
MVIQGYSPLSQPAALFSLEEYKEFLAKWLEVDQSQWGSERSTEEKNRARAQIKVMNSDYFARLPVYLLARCPLCNGRVWEAIDTFSLNGIGWRQPHGFGWSGGGWDQHAERYTYSFIAECNHAQFMTYSVNMNGLQPTDVYRSYPLGPEKPFVLKHFGQFKAVIHALPIGRYDDSAVVPRYTVYFTTSFTDQPSALRTTIVTGDPSDGGAAFHYREADYDLPPRVDRGQLHWLDTHSPELPLKNRPLESFPYANIQGIAEATWLKDGKLEPYRPWEKRQAAEKAKWQQRAEGRKGGVSGFFRSLFGPKDESS